MSNLPKILNNGRHEIMMALLKIISNSPRAAVGTVDNKAMARRIKFYQGAAPS